jgi:hypothetical protein
MTNVLNILKKINKYNNNNINNNICNILQLFTAEKYCSMVITEGGSRIMSELLED